MVDSIPIVIIVIGVILVILALLVWTRRKEVKLELERIKSRKKVFFAQWIIGIVLALLAAMFMFDGDILGENNTGISTIIGIVGISLIATSGIHLIPFGRK